MTEKRRIAIGCPSRETTTMATAGEGGRRPESRRRLRDGGTTRNIYYAVGRLAKSCMFFATFAGTLVGVGQAGTRSPLLPSVLAFVVFAPSSTMPNRPSSRALPAG